MLPRRVQFTTRFFLSGHAHFRSSVADNVCGESRPPTAGSGTGGSRFPFGGHLGKEAGMEKPNPVKGASAAGWGTNVARRS